MDCGAGRVAKTRKKDTSIAHHIAGVSNTGPDNLSHISARHEWVINPAIFRQLDQMFGPHTVDRFASVSTALLPTYNSRFADPCSAGVDALGQSDWGGENNWVNPPFRLIPRVLDVIEAQRADATVIAPMWPGQPWMRLRNTTMLEKQDVCVFSSEDSNQDKSHP